MSRLALTIGELGTGSARPLATPRRDRTRWRRIGLRAVVLVVLIAGGCLGVRWLLTSPRFAIARLETGPYRFVAADTLESIMATGLGRNLWSGAAGEIAASVAALPWTRSIRVQRRLPATLRIEFTEARPLLMVLPRPSAAVPAAGLVMVEDGRVLEFPAQLPFPALPVLADVQVIATAQAGVWQLSDGHSQVISDLIEAIARTGLEMVHPVDFILAQPDGFALVLRGREGRLLLGNEDFTARLRRFLISRAELAAGVDVDLRFRDRVTYSKRA